MNVQLNRPRFSRATARLIAAMGVVALLGGCGQTGPLYLPAPVAVAPAQAASAVPP